MILAHSVSIIVPNCPDRKTRLCTVIFRFGTAAMGVPDDGPRLSRTVRTTPSPASSGAVVARGPPRVLPGMPPSPPPPRTPTGGSEAGAIEAGNDRSPECGLLSKVLGTRQGVFRCSCSARVSRPRRLRDRRSARGEAGRPAVIPTAGSGDPRRTGGLPGGRPGDLRSSPRRGRETRAEQANRPEMTAGQNPVFFRKVLGTRLGVFQDYVLWRD